MEQGRFDLYLSNQKINCKMENESQVNEAMLFEGYTVFELFSDEPIFGDLEEDKCWIGSL